MKMQSEMFGELTVRPEQCGSSISQYYGMPFSNNGSYHIEQQIKKIRENDLRLIMYPCVYKSVEVNKVEYQNFSFEIRYAPSTMKGIWVFTRASRAGKFSNDITDAARKKFNAEIESLFSSVDNYKQIAEQCQLEEIERYKQQTKNELAKGILNINETMQFLKGLK